MKCPTKVLDEKAILGLKIWDFSLRSLLRPYNKIVIKDIMIKHPVKTIKGFSKYSEFSKEYKEDNDFVSLKGFKEKSFIKNADKNNLIIAVGFCQKPLPGKKHKGCPSGRFSHKCIYLENLNKPVPLACKDCFIKTLGEKALKAQANLYIMTTALDIAKDFFLPAINENKFKQAIVTICPYSVLPFVLPLYIANVDFLIFKYSKNTCNDWENWVSADDGNKTEQTILDKKSCSHILKLLDALAKPRSEKVRYQLENNIYIPKKEKN